MSKKAGIKSLPLKVIAVCEASEVTLSDYHNYTQLQDELETLSNSFPEIAKLYSLGQTVESRELLVMQISQGVQEVFIIK